MVWLVFAFLATMSYGGNLRAFLLKPQYPEPIETVNDILESGLNWKMVVYGDHFERHIVKNEPRLWNGKEVVGYRDFPFEVVLEIMRVFLERL